MKTTMSAETGAGLIIAKFGIVKVISFGAALVGAALMAAFRPPKTRKEMFMQGAVALGSSFILGGTIVSALDHWFDFIDLATANMIDVLQFNITIHGLIGAMAWGIFGGLAHFRDKLAVDPIQAVRDIKDL